MRNQPACRALLQVSTEMTDQREQPVSRKRIHQTLEEPLHAKLKAEAALAGMSLQDYIERQLAKAVGYQLHDQQD